MTTVYDEGIECPVCRGKFARHDLNCRTYESIWTCERCGFYSETEEVVRRDGRKFWRHSMEMPMSKDGRVARPDMRPPTQIEWNEKDFAKPGFDVTMFDGFGVEVIDESL